MTTTTTSSTTAATSAAPPAAAAPNADDVGAERYLQPDWFSRAVFNPLVARLTRWGISVWGSRVLEVRGRVSGEWRSTPVNVLDHDGQRYLVAPRGVTHWVRNVRAAGTCRLRVGRRVEDVAVEELAPADAVPVLRAYLHRWKWEVGAFFDGLDADADHAALEAAAPKHPAFRIVSVSTGGDEG